jgi:hypothetical protein
VQVTDLLPAGVSFVSANPSQGTYDNITGFWDVGTVGPGAPQTLSITATVVSPVAQTNTGTISDADQFDPTTANNSASATETPPGPGRPGHHQDRRRDQRRAGHQRHLHDRGHQQRAEHGQQRHPD